jgi:hypothetical protein
MYEMVYPQAMKTLGAVNLVSLGEQLVALSM